MAGKRVFVSGVGGELGSTVAALLEDEPWVGTIAGIDANPPRRRLARTTYHRIHPDEHDRIVSTVIDFAPHVLVHIGVWEPHSRANPADAAMLTDRATTSILGAAAECSSLENVIVRSGTEVYGRARGALSRPSETAPLQPTSQYGRTLVALERTAADVGVRVGVTVGVVRVASVIGPHVPSPLGRVLRLPAVPFAFPADPPLSVVHQSDAARAFVAAASVGLSEPVNVVASEAITASQAARRGRRIPVPVVGPAWAVTRALTHLVGAPIPDHVSEAFTRGRLADNGRMRELLGITPQRTTPEVIDDLHSWPSIVRQPARKQVA
ncbi:MAG: NAD-dependent epimerase/dehydratase family protein [Actinomycetota bacterium]